MNSNQPEIDELTTTRGWAIKNLLQYAADAKAGLDLDQLLKDADRLVEYTIGGNSIESIAQRREEQRKLTQSQIDAATAEAEAKQPANFGEEVEGNA